MAFWRALLFSTFMMAPVWAEEPPYDLDEIKIFLDEETPYPASESISSPQLQEETSAPIRKRQLPFVKRDWSGGDLKVFMKVMECVSQDKGKDIIEHIACGEHKARVLMDEQVGVDKGGDRQKIIVTDPISFMQTVPNVTFEKGAYHIQPHPQSQMVEKKIHIALNTSKVIRQWIAMSFHVTVTDYVMVEDEIRFNENGVFLNPRPLKRERMMSAKGKMKPGDTEIYSGDMWVQQPLELEESSFSYMPEKGRLWVEVSLEK